MTDYEDYDNNLAFAPADAKPDYYELDLDELVMALHKRDQQNMANKEKRIHPTQKPADLIGQIIRDYSKPGEIILDPFSGSGSTAIACHRLHRDFICIEKDREYWEASVRRLDEERRQGQLF